MAATAWRCSRVWRGGLDNMFYRKATPHLQKPRAYKVSPGFCFLSRKGGGIRVGAAVFESLVRGLK